MPLDTQMPAWLVQQFAPNPPSPPWMLQALQQGMQRYEMQQKLPLEIQQMKLNQLQTEAATKHQGLMNEVLARDLQDETEDTELYKQFHEDYGQKPNEMIDAPMPPFKSQKYQQMALRDKQAASQTSWGESYLQEQIDLTKWAHALNLKHQDTTSALIEGPFGPSGPKRWDRAELARLQTVADSEAEEQRMKEIKARTDWHTTTGASASPAERRALAIQRAQDRLNDAYDIGDQDLIDREQAFLTNLTKLQEQEKPDKVRDAELMLLRQEIVALNRQLGDITLKSKWPQLEAQKRQLEEKLQNYGKPSTVSPTVSGPQTGAPAATNTVQMGRFKMTVH